MRSWIEAVHATLKDESIIVSDLRLGVFYTAAKLSTGHVGVAFTPRNLSDTVCCPHSAASSPPAGKMAGGDAWALASYAISTVPLRRAVGVAVLNALSAFAMEEHPPKGVRVLPGMDALEAAEVRSDDSVAMVGGFVPFIKRLKGRVGNLWIVDKHPEALKPEEVAFWKPPEQAADVLPRASIVIITGSSLVEGGIDELLAASSRARRVVLAGPTASPWAPTFFKRGVHVLGGLLVKDEEKILRVVSEGGSGYFFEEGAEKVCLVPEAVHVAGVL